MKKTLSILGLLALIGMQIFFNIVIFKNGSGCFITMPIWTGLYLWYFFGVIDKHF